MGRSLRRFSGTTSSMYKLLVCSFLAMAAAAPIEDTPEVAEAKAAFKAAFDAAEAGEHAALRPDALRPVNNDVQAPQIAPAYLDDTEDVAAAKAAFQAAFDEAAAGGLAAKQAPAPVHVIPAPAPLVAAAPVLATHPYAAGFPIHGLGYAGIPYAGLGYNGLAYNTLGYHGLGYHGLGYHGLGLPYTGLPVVTAAAPAAEE